MSLFSAWSSKKLKPIDPTDKPKVLIGVAGFHGVVPRAQENFFELAFHCGRRCPDYDFLLKIVIKREQFRARNSLVDLAIMNGCEYLLMLDDDMIVPPNLFERMAAHDKDVLGALYFQRGGAYHPVLMKRYLKTDGLVGVDFLHHFDPMIVKRGLYKLDGVIGGGCMLFKVDVFRKIPQPYFWIDGIVGTDVHICQQLQTAGVDLWVDTSIELGHVGEEKIVGSGTIPQYSRVLGQINEELWEDLRAYLTLDNDQLESAVMGAAAGQARKLKWEQEPRETWEQVRKFYQDFGTWHVLNLGRYNLTYDRARDWVINEMGVVAKPGQHIVDFGAGLGYCTLPMIRAGYRVTAIDLASTPTLDFLRWRLKEKGLEAEVLEFEDPVPPNLSTPADGLVMISVFDHLWDPHGVLDWADRNVRKGGWMLCDTFYNLKSEDEPQHLIKYNPHRIMHEVRKRGWVNTPENPLLFVKEK